MKALEPIAPTDTAWRAKATRIIGELCRASYLQANPKPGKRHRPYSIPPIAADLVKCLDTNDEEQAKAIFMRILDTPECVNDP